MCLLYSQTVYWACYATEFMILQCRWIGLTGQFRPKKLISSLKEEIAGIEEWEVSNVKDIAKHFWDKSLFSINLCTQLSLSPLSSLFFSTEAHGEKKGSRSKAMFMHKASFVLWPLVLYALKFPESLFQEGTSNFILL